jgi:hypothetical protein
LVVVSFMSYLPLGYVVDLNKVKVMIISAICRINYYNCIVDMYEYDIDLNQQESWKKSLCYYCLLVLCLFSLGIDRLFT